MVLPRQKHFQFSTTQNMKNKLIFALVFFGILIPLSVFMFRYFEGSRYEELRKYRLITLKNSCDIIVKKKSFDRGWCKVVTSGNDSILFSGARNNSYPKKGIEREFGVFINSGDHVLKYSKNDTLYVLRNEKEFYFVGDFYTPRDSSAINVDLIIK